MTFRERIELNEFARRLDGLKPALRKRCRCGRPISQNKSSCAACAQIDRLADLGVVVPNPPVQTSVIVKPGTLYRP